MRINLLMIFLCLSALLFTSESQAQITIQEKNVDIEKIFKLIEQQSKLTFLYDSQDINGIMPLTVNLSNKSLKEALNQILRNVPLTYKITANTILVKRDVSKNVKPNQKVMSQKIDAIVIRGLVMDEHKIPLKNVSIKEPKLNTSTLSDNNGRFVIEGSNQGILVLSATGFVGKNVLYADTAFLTITMENGSNKTIDLAEVKIESNNVLSNPTRFINLENRSYMNLSQVLQGTIPGLSLQIVNTSTKTITSIDHYVQFLNGQPYGRFMRSSVEDFLNIVGKTKGQQIIDILLKGTNIPASISNFNKLNVTTTISNTLVPEIRGASNFGSNVSNMLVVIDGFPQDGFPANYPMNNVESIEVIKDPKELIKWGARAAGGAILIKSKAAKAGKLEFNYTTSLYLSPAPKFNRENLRLANTPTYLNYLSELDELTKNAYGSSTFGLSFARELLNKKRSGLISASSFDLQWDSLSRLDNQDQLALLQQDAFSQNHSLTVSGGNSIYRFTALGNYIGSTTNNINSRNDELSLRVNNDFNLLNNKLRIRWLINLSDKRTKSGYSFSSNNIGIDPYQMLLDPQGNYVYDYTTLSTSANQLIQSRGYKNPGVNLLEDARANNLSSVSAGKQSNFNMNWELLPGLQWATSMLYNHRVETSRTLFGAESSYVRQFANSYGQLNTTGVNFYVPYGDIMRESERTVDDANLRTGLTYLKVIGKHSISIGVGAGGASITRSMPSYGTLYGYNDKTKTSTPIYLATNPTQLAIRNFYALFPGTSSTAFPASLTQNTIGDTSVVRNLNGNASVTYNFSDRIKAYGLYTAVLNPLYGQSETYSTLSSYSGDVTGRVVKDAGRFLKDVLVSVGTNGIQMPNLPGKYNNKRYLQNYWNNYAIIVDGAIPTQQQGQSSKLYYQKLTLAFADSTIVANGAYNTQLINGDLSSNLTSNTIDRGSRTLKYLSAGLDLFLRKRLLDAHFSYAKSPEGNKQFNGSLNYNISKESFFRSDKINDLSFNMLFQDISPYQGLAIMQSTNVATNGSYTQATSSDFGLLPAQSKLFEAHGKIAFAEDRYSMDLRYYNQTSNGLNNNLSVLTDPSTGLSNQVSFSSITNRGVEFFFNTQLIKTAAFNYILTVNGARNTNRANDVPLTRFTATNDYTVALREGNDVSSIYAPLWAGLNNTGNPQIFDSNGQVTAVLDSATLVSSLIRQGVTKAPWTGGLIQEFKFNQFFARVAVTFNLGHVMRYYLPYPGNFQENSSLLADRWRKPGDEAFTDIPVISTSGANTYREFVSRYSSNSIIPADNIRLSEVMVGFSIPEKRLKKYGLSYMTMTFQVQNLAFWASNKYKIDPATVSVDGRIGMPLPKIYSCNLSVNF